MKLTTLTFSIFIVLASASSAIAWTPQWGPVMNPSTGYSYAGASMNQYQTVSARNSWDYAPAMVQPVQQRAMGTMYGAPNAGMYANSGWGGVYDYSDRSGPYLTAPGDAMMRNPQRRYSDPVYVGAYSGYTGMHYDTFARTVQSQNPYQPLTYPARRYPDPRFVTTEWQ